jgi:hypothetical protein
VRRRGILIGGGAVIGVAAAGAAWKWHLFGKHYPPTPYDDLLGQIADREPARLFGTAVVPSWDRTDQLAASLRQDGRTLSVRAQAEPGEAQVTEVAGWVVPQSVALYAALAART